MAKQSDKNLIDDSQICRCYRHAKLSLLFKRRVLDENLGP